MNRRPFLAGLFACCAMVALVVLARADQTVLYEKASAYNTIVVTEEENGLRVLRFGRGGARQSVVKLGDPVKYGFLHARDKSQHGRVLRDRELEQRKGGSFSK